MKGNDGDGEEEKKYKLEENDDMDVIWRKNWCNEIEYRGSKDNNVEGEKEK